MDSSGNLYTPEQVAALSATERSAKKLVDVPADELERVQAMNRHERRKWHAEQRKLARKNAGRERA